MIVGRSFAETSKSMLAIDRVAASAEGIPMAILNSTNASGRVGPGNRAGFSLSPVLLLKVGFAIA